MKKLKLIEIYKSLQDRPLHEQEEPKSEDQFKEEIVEIDIPGVDGKTKVKIEYKDSNQVNKALKDVTITFMYGAEEDVPGVTSNNEGDEVEKYTNVDFTEVEKKEDHENEGQDWIFIAEGDDSMSFEVEVSVDATMEDGLSWEPDFDSIQEIQWDTLRPFMTENEGESLNENEKDLESAIIDVLKKEGGAAGLEPILAIANKLGATKSEIKKVLNSIGKVKKHTNGDYILTPINEQPRPDYADVDGDGDEEESMEKAFKDKEKMDEQGCTEQEIAEGTCGYSPDGKPRRKPAGPNLMRERFQKLANIKK